MPHGSQNMLDLWNQSAGSTGSSSANRQLIDARLQLRRPLMDADSDQRPYTRTAQNEIYSQFKRLPNPDLVMYVFPHLTGTDPAPIPGYSTVFPLYQRVQYAMPGERTEDY
jgi:conjugative transfer region lipoprotein (TIGR03751 family)